MASISFRCPTTGDYHTLTDTKIGTHIGFGSIEGNDEYAIELWLEVSCMCGHYHELTIPFERLTLNA